MRAPDPDSSMASTEEAPTKPTMTNAQDSTAEPAESGVMHQSRAQTHAGHRS